MSDKILYAPQIDNFIECYGERGYSGINGGKTYDEESYKIIDKIFKLLKKITPISSNGCRELWFRAERGPIEAYGDYDEWLADDYVKNYEEFEESWKNSYPKDDKWYCLQVVEDEKNDYRVISINHNIVININEYNRKGFEHKITTYVQWMYDSIQGCIELMKAGTYMDNVQANLPVENRTGTILRSELWELFPEDKEEFFEGLKDYDIKEFINHMKIQSEDDYFPKEVLKDITANDFYRYCSVGYAAMGYKYCDLTPKEQYYKHADGRDEGLSEIDGDSVEAFKRWFFEDRIHGGHPWEVCRGGNSTHISLYLKSKDENYILHLAGSAYSRTNETIKFYLALKRYGLPVVLSDGYHHLERALGIEKVGVVPQNITPKYRHSDFPNEDIISFINLPYEDTELVAAKCVWQNAPEVKLLEEGVS